MWGEALEYFCGQPHDCSVAISEVLRHIEAGALLPPLVLLQTLAKNKQLKVRARMPGKVANAHAAGRCFVSLLCECFGPSCMHCNADALPALMHKSVKLAYWLWEK